VPVVHGNRLFLYLAQIMVKTLTPEAPRAPGAKKNLSLYQAARQGAPDMKTATPKNWEIRMAWTEFLKGQWAPQRVSQVALVVKWDSAFPKEPLPSLGQFTFQNRKEGNTLAINVGRLGPGAVVCSHS
jgi:hypothetical protein